MSEVRKGFCLKASERSKSENLVVTNVIEGYVVLVPIDSGVQCNRARVASVHKIQSAIIERTRGGQHIYRLGKR